MSFPSNLIFIFIFYFINSLGGHSIKSFGFTTNSSLSNASNVTMRLYWDTFIYQCNSIYSRHKNNLLSFACNVSNVSNNHIKFCNNTNYVSPKYELTIQNHFEESINIRSIHIKNTDIFDYNLSYLFTGNVTLDFTNNIQSKNPLISDLEFDCPKVKVSSIEIVTSGGNGYPNGNLNITLFWGYQILECIIEPHIIDTNQRSNALLTHFFCNNSEIKLLGQSIHNTYAVRLYYGDQHLVRIGSITIVDLYANEYTITTFCGPLHFAYWDEPLGGPIPIPELCQDNYFTHKNLYSYEYIEMATDTAYLTTLYINFKHNILMSNATFTATSLVSPAKINSFGIKTAPATDGESHDYIYAMLYWNLNIYSCSLYINANDQYFNCNNMNISTSNEVAFKLIIEQHDRFKHSGLIIEEVRVSDSSGNQYIIDSFCLSNSENDAITSGQCTDFAVPETDLYQLKVVKFGNNHSAYYDKMCIGFSNLLFKKPNQSQHGYVHRILDIKKFGIKITSGGSIDVTLTLYWRLTSYKCSLDIFQTNQMYYCNASNAILQMNRCSMYGMSIDNFDSNNALYFENIIVHLNDGKYYGINTTNIYLATKMTQYIQFPNNTLDFPNSLSDNIGKIVDHIKCNVNETTLLPEHEPDIINKKLDTILWILVAFGAMLFVMCAVIICMFFYFQQKRKQDMRSPTRKSSINHLSKSKSKTPSDIGKNFSYKRVIPNDNKEEDIDIPGQLSERKLSKSVSSDSSLDEKDNNEVRIMIAKKKSQREGFIETKLKSDTDLKVIKASDEIESNSSLHIPFKNNDSEINLDNNDDEKEDVLGYQINEGNNSPQNAYVNSNVLKRSDSDSDDMYENPGDDVKTEQ